MSQNLGILDYPSDSELKIHKKPMPLLGGIGIAMGVLASLIAIGILFNNSQRILVGLLTALLIILFFGLLDDIKGLKPAIKLFGHICSAFAAVLVLDITLDFFPYWYVSIPVTAFCLIASANSINLLDGIDGLATGITMIAALGFFVAFTLQGDTVWAALSLALISVTGSFLIFNFHPARIFLGDNGSNFLGFYLGLLAVKYASNSFVHLFVPVLILIVPIMDITLAIGRRISRQKPISTGDRNHYYDKLIKRGFSQKQTSLISYFIGILGASAAIFIIII